LLEEEARRWNRLSKAAFITAVIHFVAGLFMAIVLRNGLDTANLPDRLSFLSEQWTLWFIGWLTWNLAALAILYFYFCFANAHSENNKHANLLHFAVLLTASGMAIDFCAEAIEVGVIPNLAQMILVHSGNVAETAQQIFLALHRTAVMMTGCFANELYTVSAAILVYATWKHYNWLVRSEGCLLVIGGSWLSIACLFNSVSGMFFANLILLPMLILWLLTIAYLSWQKAKVI